MSMPITQVDKSGEEVARIVNAMEQVFGDENREVMLMACLSLSILIQHENITMEQLQAGVLGASEWIALYLTSLEEQETGEKLVVN